MAQTSTITENFSSLVDGTQEAIVSQKRYNITVRSQSFVGTIQLQRSFDGGVNWSTVKEVTDSYDGVGIEPETGVRYRFACTAYTSGTAVCRLGQGKY